MNYLIELSVVHIVLILGYWLFLRKERQYAKMRFYLLASTLLALIIPLIKLPKLFFNSTESLEAVQAEVIPLDVAIITPDAGSSIGSEDLLIGIYVIISSFLLLKFLRSVFHIMHLERNSRYERFNDLYIRRVKDIKGSFSFFNWIFLSDEIDSNQQDYEVILKHQKAHSLMGHTYDRVFFELFKVCFWWLPFTWFVLREIKKIHEYQADACALEAYSLDHYSSILISSTLKSNGLSLASSFHDGLILKRLKAMKQQTKNVSLWKLGTLMSLCTLLFIVFACTEELDKRSAELGVENESIQEEVFTKVEEQPEFEGGMDGFYQYISGEIRYLAQARRLGVEGQVYVQFVVERDGSLSHVEAVQGIGAGCDREAVRVIQNAPAFKPGSQRGRTVRVKMGMPILFKLKEGEVNPDNSAQGFIVVEEVESKNGKLKIAANYSDGEWSGTVYSPEGDILPAANIVVAGTSKGTVSNFDGTLK